MSWPENILNEIGLSIIARLRGAMGHFLFRALIFFVLILRGLLRFLLFPPKLERAETRAEAAAGPGRRTLVSVRECGSDSGSV